MTFFVRLCALGACLQLVLLSAASQKIATAADAASPPAVSTFAPIGALGEELTFTLDSIDKTLGEAEYGEDQQKDVRAAAHAVVAMAQAIGLSDEDSAWKASALEIMMAAKELAKKSEKAEDAKNALAALKTLVEASKADNVSETPKSGDAPVWKKEAGLGAIMRHAANLQGRVERSFKRFDKQGKKALGAGVSLAVIANAASFDTHEVKDPAQIGEWVQFAAAMREAAVNVQKASQGSDAEAAQQAVKMLEKSCADCHNVFHKEY